MGRGHQLGRLGILERLSQAGRGAVCSASAALHPVPALPGPCQLTKAEALLLRGYSTGQCWVQQLLLLLGSLTLPGAPRQPWSTAMREAGDQGSDGKEGVSECAYEREYVCKSVCVCVMVRGRWHSLKEERIKKKRKKKKQKNSQALPGGK